MGFLSSRRKVISMYPLGKFRADDGEICHVLCKWQNMSEQLQEEPKLEPDCSGDQTKSSD